MKKYYCHISFAYLAKTSDFPAGTFSNAEKRRYIPEMQMHDAITDYPERVTKKQAIKDFKQSMKAAGRRVTVYACDMFEMEEK